jgi:uncharacterized protein YecA (UPF0149 family)
MQETRFTDGSVIRKMFMARDEDDLAKQRDASEKAAEAAGKEIESIRQSVLNPESRCPCGSGKLTKNCCIKRLRRYVKNQEHFAKV